MDQELRRNLLKHAGGFDQENLVQEMDRYLDRMAFPLGQGAGRLQPSAVEEWSAESLGFVDFPLPYVFAAVQSKDLRTATRVGMIHGSTFVLNTTSNFGDVGLSPRTVDCVLLPADSSRRIELRTVSDRELQIGLPLAHDAISLERSDLEGAPFLLYVDREYLAQHQRPLWCADRLRVGKWYAGQHAVGPATNLSPWAAFLDRDELAPAMTEGADLIDWRQLLQLSADPTVGQAFLEIPYSLWSRLESNGGLHWLTVDVGNHASEIVDALNGALHLNALMMWNLQYHHRGVGVAHATLEQLTPTTVAVRRPSSLRAANNRLPLVLSVYDSDRRSTFYNQRFSTASEREGTFSVVPPGDLARDMAHLEFLVPVRASSLRHDFFIGSGSDYFASADPNFDKLPIYGEVCEFRPLSRAPFQSHGFRSSRFQSGYDMFDSVLHATNRRAITRTDLEWLVRRNPMAELRERISADEITFSMEFTRREGVLAPVVRITVLLKHGHGLSPTTVELYRDWLERYLQQRAASTMEVRLTLREARPRA